MAVHPWIAALFPPVDDVPAMYEVEIKVRSDHGPVRERLEDLGATRLERLSQADTYYDAPDRSFAETDEALRIRRATPRAGTDAADRRTRPDGPDRRVRLTYKGPKVDDASKTRRELETGVQDADAMADVLEALGYERVATVRKDRTTYELEGHEVTLDAVEALGTFVEVETEVDDEDGIDRAREDARDLLERLGLDPDRGIRASYLELLLAGDRTDDR